ncbi:MAG: hypothetical protein KAT25_06080 [Sulfuriflexus sp.]|nr:hypothetical protein [Sulfuriflexus sp.]
MDQNALREVSNVAQPDKHLNKRWFSSQAGDLFVWHDGERFARFEFCYNKYRNEYSLRWKLDTGFSHARIDDGETGNSYKSSPILITESEIDSDYIFEIFKKLSDKVDMSVRFFIMRKLLGFVHSEG